MTTDALTRRRFLGLAVAATATAGLAACSTSSDAINLVGYSVAKSVYDAVRPEFAKTKAGKGVTIQASYGASGDQSRQVVKGMVSNSVVVIAVRKGNPLGIKGWDDIVMSGVDIVTPNRWRRLSPPRPTTGSAGSSTR